MATKPSQSYQPMTPPLTLGERIADVLVMGVLIFWFSFLGLTPQKLTPGVHKPGTHKKRRPADLPKRPLNTDDEAQKPLGVAAE